MNAELVFFLEQFPDFKEQIKSLFERDEEFQALCLDYFLCIRSHDHWELTIRKYQERMEGYIELKRVLENRLLQQVNQEKHSKIDPPGSEASKLSSAGSKVR